MPNIFAFTRPQTRLYCSPYRDAPFMSRSTLLPVSLAVAVVLILMILYYTLSPCVLATRLARCGWIVYYRQGCGYCTQQKHILKGKFRKYIECSASGYQIDGYTTSPPLPCNSPAIMGFPFWYNTRTKETRPGLQDTSALEMMAQA